MASMPIYLVTLHTYRSWTEDNPHGYVQRGRAGIQPPQPRLARHRAQIAKHAPVRFCRKQMQLALDVAQEVSVRLGHSPLAGSCTAMHLHVVVSVVPSTIAGRMSTGRKAGAGEVARLGAEEQSTSLTGGVRDVARSVDDDVDRAVDALCSRIKSIVGLRLSQQQGTVGNRWFSRGKDATVVSSRKHLYYLLETYLPRHELAESGIFVRWCGTIEW